MSRLATKAKLLIDQFSQWKTRNLTHHQFLMFLSSIIGFIAGLVAVTIKNFTHYIQLLLEGELVVNYHEAFYFIFPIIGLALTVLIVKFGFKKEVGYGIPIILHAMSKRNGIMRKFQTYASLITAPITVGFGGSVGLEAPTVVTGAAISSNLSRMFNLNQASRTLLIGCAAAGAMSALFKAPIAAIIFAIEIFSLDLTLISMIPLLLASVSAILTTYFFSGSDIILHSQLSDEFQISDVPFYILLGIISSIVSIYFTKIYFKINNLFSKIDSPFKRLLIGGISLGILIFFVPPLYGEGYDVINNLLQENYMYALQNNLFEGLTDSIWLVIALLAGLVVFKIIATSLTLGAGGIGGIFAPVLFMGSTMGHCFALIMNNLNLLKSPLSVSNFTMVGMAGLMAGIMHAPLTAIFLIAELTSGYELFVPLMITAAISFMITSQFQPHSVYTLDLANRGELITHNKDQMVLTLLNIKQVIETNFVELNVEMNLGEVIHEGVIKSSRNLFPVLDENKHFVGILLLDDIRPVMFDRELYDKIVVRELMQRAPEIIDLKQDRMKEIMKKFNDTDAWNLPVVENGMYIGFVSKSKLLTAYRQKLIEVTV